MESLQLPGLWDGLMHPVLGVDHLLAMISVGVVSAVLGKRVIWTLPAAFVIAMAIGGVAGMSAVILPKTEACIAVSLVALGLIVATRATISGASRQLPVGLAMVFVIVFGTAHGNAHGQEIPSAASPISFTVGFLVATTGLHLTGVFAGKSAIKQRWSTGAMRLAGMFTAALGVGLLTR